MNSYFFNSNKGSASSVGFILLGALALTGLVIENQNNLITAVKQKSKMQRAADAVSTTSVAQLSRTRGLLSFSTNSGVANINLPALYPDNYNDPSDIKLAPNPYIAQPNHFQIDASGKIITLWAPTSHDFNTQQDVWSIAPTAPYTPPIPITIQVLNRIPYDQVTDPYVTHYVEVQITSQDPTTSQKRVERARIALADPKAFKATLQISNDGGTSWSDVSTGYSIDQNPHMYRVLADGVAWDATVMVDGNVVSNGNKIATSTVKAGTASSATNIYGRRQVVGTFQSNIAGQFNASGQFYPEFWDSNKARTFVSQATGCLVDTVDSPQANVHNDRLVTLTINLTDPRGSVLYQQTVDHVTLQSPLVGPNNNIGLDYDGTNEQFVAACPNACDFYGLYQWDANNWGNQYYAEGLKDSQANSFPKALMHWGAKQSFLKGPYGVCSDMSIAGPEAMAFHPTPTDANSFGVALEGPSGTGIAIGDAGRDQQYVGYDDKTCTPRVIFARNDCGCFNEQTRILLADGSEKPIAQIGYQDVVYNPITGSGYMIKKIIAGPEKFPLITVTIGGSSVEVTREHPFITRHGMISAEQLKVGDIVLNAGGGYSAVEAKEVTEYATQPTVWNIELLGGENANEHYLVADGVLTGDLYLQNQLKGQTAHK